MSWSTASNMIASCSFQPHCQGSRSTKCGVSRAERHLFGLAHPNLNAYRSSSRKITSIGPMCALPEDETTSSIPTLEVVRATAQSLTSGVSDLTQLSTTSIFKFLAYWQGQVGMILIPTLAKTRLRYIRKYRVQQNINAPLILGILQTC